MDTTDLAKRWPEVPGWTPPDAERRREIIGRAKSVAVVGASSNPARASNFVATYLLSSSTDFDVYFVNPAEREILGREVYSSLDSLPVAPDITDVFRRAECLPDVAEEAVAVGSKTFWAQLGLWSPQAIQICVAAGMNVVMDRCLKIEHARFAGGLSWAGFNTGVISSRRGRFR